MSTRYDRAFNRLVISLVLVAIFFVMFASQLGGGSNTGGVFPAPVLVIGLLGASVSFIVFIVSSVQVFSYRSDNQNGERSKKDA